MPLAFDLAGATLSSMRRQLDTWQRMPAVVSTYAPNGTGTIMNASRRLWKRMPISSFAL